MCLRYYIIHYYTVMYISVVGLRYSIFVKQNNARLYFYRNAQYVAYDCTGRQLTQSMFESVFKAKEIGLIVKLFTFEIVVFVGMQSSTVGFLIMDSSYCEYSTRIHIPFSPAVC